MSEFNNWGGKSSGKNSFNFRGSGSKGSKGSQYRSNDDGNWKGMGKGSNDGSGSYDGSQSNYGQSKQAPQRHGRAQRRVSFSDSTKPLTFDDVPLNDDDGRVAGDGNTRNQSSFYSEASGGSGFGNFHSDSKGGYSGGAGGFSSDGNGRPPLPDAEYRRRMAFDERSKFSGNMVTTSDSEIRSWVMSAIPEIGNDNTKVDGAVATLRRKIMPMFNMARSGFNPHTWKFMNRFMVKCFCTDAEMEADGAPEFFLWLFRSLFGYRGPRPLFDNQLLLIDFFLDGTFENMISHELAFNPDLCGGSKIISAKIEKLREERRKAVAKSGSSNGKKKMPASPVSGTSIGDAFASVGEAIITDVSTPEDQITTAEIRMMKKLMKKFNSMDNEDGEDDSPISRRKNGKLKRRRSSRGGDGDDN